MHNPSVFYFSLLSFGDCLNNLLIAVLVIVFLKPIWKLNCGVFISCVDYLFVYDVSVHRTHLHRSLFISTLSIIYLYTEHCLSAH